KTHQRARIFLGIEPAVSAERERRDDSLGARLLVARALRIADEEPLAGRGVGRALRVVRAVDSDAADMRIEREARQSSGLDRAALEVVVDVEQRREVRREKGHA